MYIPNSFAERDTATLFDFIEAHPLGALVTSEPGSGLFATHLPLVLDRATGPWGTLLGHIARANPHSRLGNSPVSALVIFTGPNAYITPTWYATKRESGRVVPTWNYAVVHAYGTLRLRDDAEFLRAHLEALTNQHESQRSSPWQLDDAPADYIAQQMKAIVGVEFTIERLEGKWKMSQNRSPADIDGVVHGLSESQVPQEQTVASIVRDRRPQENA
ncbi:MAG: FMN-binding negative transcriptional regulator [Gemmatimonadaceae bacterium]|nr:FMN-binding negative transcriptional regulator [Gemmatimonadaceae bacterium]